MRILLVEDNADVGEAIVARLERMGHAIDWLRNGDEAETSLRVQRYDLIVLDVMLPGKDGLSLLSAFRKAGGATPVLMLTARSQVSDRVSALDVGADDYLVKPFDFRELEARVRALLRRAGGSSVSTCCSWVTSGSTRCRAVSPLPASNACELTRREITLLEIPADQAAKGLHQA